MPISLNSPKRPKIGYTAAHSILKNEIKYIDKFLEYTKELDYVVLLDTGSTDGSWEYLQELAKTDNRLIIDQYIQVDFRFDYARLRNLEMVPKNTSWVFAPDLDEYFSRNTLDQLELYLEKHPTMTNMSCSRLDIYSYEVHVGQPRHIGSNKIFKYGDYTWKSIIYEHVSWVHKDRYENEVYNPDIYLIHDQDYKKTSSTRSPLYKKLLIESQNEGPEANDFSWTGWFLLDVYFKEQNLTEYVKTAVNWLPHCTEKEKYDRTLGFLKRILEFNPPELTSELKNLISPLI